MSAAERGTVKGAVSHAVAATTLNLQRRIGDVAHSAARAAASPPKSHSGRGGRRARIGTEKSAIPHTAAKVRIVPTEKTWAGAAKNRISAESPMAWAWPMGRSKKRVAMKIP